MYRIIKSGRTQVLEDKNESLKEKSFLLSLEMAGRGLQYFTDASKVCECVASEAFDVLWGVGE